MVLFVIFHLYAQTLSYAMLQQDSKDIQQARFMSLLHHSSSSQ